MPRTNTRTLYDVVAITDDHEKRLDSVEKTIIVHAEKIDNLEECSKEFRNDVKAMRKILDTSELAIKIGTWIIATFGVSVIALIWSLIIGKASIVFK